jgi:hypothetical protein
MKPYYDQDGVDVDEQYCEIATSRLHGLNINRAEPACLKGESLGSVKPFSKGFHV